MTAASAPTFSHKQLAANCFNAVWELLDLNVRTKEEEEKMIHLAHASFWNWTQVQDHTPRNISIGYWQLSRVYATCRNGERAGYYAERCLEVSLENKLEPFYIGYAYEALARADALLSQKDQLRKHIQLAMEYIQMVQNQTEKEMLMKDLHGIDAD
ncbi:hypothetical protein [Neobacillus mesonae]|uniref:hypothetical protein n=1 Tax=Neobacillus mesonae TaxID=1193713 RepID=UPI0008306040|nr:hypothetical protein [Neobacillus mesonae]